MEAAAPHVHHQQGHAEAGVQAAYHSLNPEVHPLAVSILVGHLQVLIREDLLVH